MLSRADARNTREVSAACEAASKDWDTLVSDLAKRRESLLSLAGIWEKADVGLAAVAIKLERCREKESRAEAGVRSRPQALEARDAAKVIIEI